MSPLGFSVIGVGNDALLTELTARSKLECRMSVMTWDRAWEEIARVAIYRTGPDVSQVPATWVGSFVSMDAVRPFSEQEADAIGGSAAFLPSAWRAGLVGQEEQVWAIPWLADVRVIYYWRDLLERAGVDEGAAFQTPERLEDTLERLRAGGEVAPWVVPTHSTLITFQNVASWVWRGGAEFIGADGKEVLFAQPEVLAEIGAYFSLYRYFPEDAGPLDHYKARSMFLERQAAVTMGPSGWIAEARRLGVADDIGTALPPGPPFVGGSDLAIWHHTPHGRDAVELVRFLTSKEIQVEYCSRTGHLPVRLEAMDEQPFSTDPHYRVMMQALKAGRRAHPSILRWGLVEDKLSDAFIRIWDGIQADPDRDLDALIALHLERLASRVKMVLA